MDNKQMGNCPLCNLVCSRYDYPRKGDYSWYICPSCGEFGLTHDALRSISEIELAKEKLGMLITERHLAGYPNVVVSDDYTGEKNGTHCLTYKEILHSFPKPEQILDRVIKNLSHMVNHITEVISVEADDRFIYFALDTEGMIYILKQLNELDYTSFPRSISGKLRIQARGWQRIAEIQSGSISTSLQAFTAMWFHESMQLFYEEGIKLAVEADGNTRCVRIDTKEHNNKICDEIIKEINNSRYIVADFTGNRGGVYYEAGYAHGIGLPVIYTVKKTDINDLHFDTRQYNHIVYETVAELYEKLQNRIAATIKL